MNEDPPAGDTARILSLSRARKTKARAGAQAAGSANAAKFGRTKAERILQAARDAKAQRALDAHRLEDE